jgi:hypothetical protein
MMAAATASTFLVSIQPAFTDAERLALAGYLVIPRPDPRGLHPDRRIVLLTMFRKTRQHEQRQIDRAVRAEDLRTRPSRPRDGDLRKAGVR